MRIRCAWRVATAPEDQRHERRRSLDHEYTTGLCMTVSHPRRFCNATARGDQCETLSLFEPESRLLKAQLAKRFALLRQKARSDTGTFDTGTFAIEARSVRRVERQKAIEGLPRLPLPFESCGIPRGASEHLQRRLGALSFGGTSNPDITPIRSRIERMARLHFERFRMDGYSPRPMFFFRGPVLIYGLSTWACSSMRTPSPRFPRPPSNFLLLGIGVIGLLYKKRRRQQGQD